jgi:hypothetical protein
VRRSLVFFAAVGLLCVVATSAALAKATITASPSSINFGKVPVTTGPPAAEVTVTLTNNSKTDVKVNGAIWSDHTDFAVTFSNNVAPLDCSLPLAPGAYCEADLYFVLAATGRYRATISFVWYTSTTTGQTSDIALTGIGTD